MEDNNDLIKHVQFQKWEANGIVLSQGNLSYSKKGKINSSNANDTVRLHIGLKGDYSFHYKEINGSFNLIGGHHNIMYSNGINLEVENRTDEIETFGIEFSKELFLEISEDSDPFINSFCESILNNESVILSDNWGSITSDIQSVIDEIKFNPYTGKLQEIFLFAKSLELLVLCIDNYVSKNKKSYTFIKSDLDKEKLIQVRDFINTQYKSPPSLSELSKLVGLNEFKLKNGFKELFGSTIFNYIRNKRLLLAKNSLENDGISISEAAYEYGYSSPQHFSLQFKKQFGITPKSVQKTP